MAARLRYDSPPFFFLLALIVSGIRFTHCARVFTIVNYCRETIWPAMIPGNNLDGAGLVLRPGQSTVFTAPVGWSGRIWARTGCNFDRQGNGSCQTGGCGSSLKCDASGEPPMSLAEFTLAAVDFYDVSLVDGFNLPLVVTPINGTGNCSVAGCDTDLRSNCTKELSLRSGGGGGNGTGGRRTIGCRSACDVFGTDEYCCRGVYENSVTCRPTYYSRQFKEACPAAYSYAYDDPSSIFTCSGTDYVISFCSSRGRQVCTYHDNKLMCSGSTTRDVKYWWMTILALVITKFFIGL